jgi:nucleoside-diphosphate-sugar epimerase
VIVNPSTILGYGDWNTSSCKIFKTVHDEFPWYTTGINGFVDIEDVSKAIVMLAEKNISGQRFIINGENWSFQKLFNTIADGFGKKHPHRKATPLLGEIALRMEKIKSLFSGERPLLTKESARVAHSHTYFSNDKLLAALPQFSFTPLEESIKRACKKYLDAINTTQP